MRFYYPHRIEVFDFQNKLTKTLFFIPWFEIINGLAPLPALPVPHRHFNAPPGAIHGHVARSWAPYFGCLAALASGTARRDGPAALALVSAVNVFCDLLQLSLPIRHDPRWSRGGAASVEMHGDQLLAALDEDSDWDMDESAIAALTGFGLSARDVQISADGTVSVQRLQFNWDILPSSYTGIGVRIAGRHRGRGDSAAAAPRVILRASPAKILQGHNAYSDIFSLSDAALVLLERAFWACPELSDLCDPADALVDEIHVTGGWRCATPVQVSQILERLRSYRYRNWRAADTAESDAGRGLSGYKTSLSFSPSSEYHRGVLYQKGPECAANWPRPSASSHGTRRTPISPSGSKSFRTRRSRLMPTAHSALRGVGCAEVSSTTWMPAASSGMGP